MVILTSWAAPPSGQCPDFGVGSVSNSGHNQGWMPSLSCHLLCLENKLFNLSLPIFLIHKMGIRGQLFPFMEENWFWPPIEMQIYRYCQVSYIKWCWIRVLPISQSHSSIYSKSSPHYWKHTIPGKRYASHGAVLFREQSQGGNICTFSVQMKYFTLNIFSSGLAEAMDSQLIKTESQAHLTGFF